MKILSIITIRKGSKGLRNKCVLKINDKATFEYVTEYSLELNRRLKGKVFTIVSSDSEVVRKYCSKNSMHFIERDPSLSTDTTQIEEVIYDVYCKIGKDFDYISLLYGNIPIRYPEEFLKAYNFLEENRDYDAVLSMQNVGKFNPAWMLKLNEHILPAKKSKGYRRQDLDLLMIHDGHTILFKSRPFLNFMKRQDLKNKKGLYDSFGKKIKPMLNDRVIVDIDTEKDLEFAKAVLFYQAKKRRKS